MQYDAPTTRHASGGWALTRLRRMFGLSILNALCATALNGTMVIRFAVPAAVMGGPLRATATAANSYGLSASFVPRRDWQEDVAAPLLFILFVGDRDEACVAETDAPVMQPFTDQGKYHVVPGCRHLQILDAPETAAAIAPRLVGLS